MSSQGPNQPSTISEATFNGFSWLEAPTYKKQYVSVDDEYYAAWQFSGVDTTISDYLNLTDFDFSIPTGAIINGIEVIIERKGYTSNPDGTTMYGLKDNLISLIKNGTVQGSNKASATIWTADSTVVTYGSSSDLWGLSFSETDVNNSNFGISIRLEAGFTDLYFIRGLIDFINIIVYYTISYDTYTNLNDIISPNTNGIMYISAIPTTSVNSVINLGKNVIDVPETTSNESGGDYSYIS